VVPKHGTLVGQVLEALVAEQVITAGPDKGGQEVLDVVVGDDVAIGNPDSLEEVVYVVLRAVVGRKDTVFSGEVDVVGAELQELLVAELTEEGERICLQLLEFKGVAKVVEIDIMGKVALGDGILVHVNCYFKYAVSL
jgi:hypothetical protein